MLAASGTRLDEPTTLLEPSPFDWNTQALCYLPPRLPEPMSRDFNAALIDALRPVLEASGGRAFVLFASHRALRDAAESVAFYRGEEDDRVG